MSPSRPVARLRPVLTAAALSLALTGLVDTAHAADGGYRFWGYSHEQGGRWVPATTGADKYTPADGSVEGWRFALVLGSTPRTPRDTLSFDRICAGTPAQDGRKRVAVVIDPGRAADAPRAGTSVPRPTARCVVVDRGASGGQVLAAAGTVRQSKGLTCAVDSYPATGCGDPVPAARISAAAKAADTPVSIEVAGSSPTSSTGSRQDTSSSSAPRIWAGVGILAVLGVLAAVALRGRRSR